MKRRVLITLFSISIIINGCEKSSTEQCGGDQPEKSLTWLKTKIEVLASSPFCYSIARSTYKSQTVFIVSTCDPNVDSRPELYYCNGNQLTLTTEEYQNLNFTGNIDLIWKNR